MCFRVERANVFLSTDSRILMCPSLPQSFEFHASTDLAHWVAREEALIVGIFVHTVRAFVGGEEWKHAGEIVLATFLYSAGGRRKNVTPLLNLGKLTLFKHSCQGRAKQCPRQVTL